MNAIRKLCAAAFALIFLNSNVMNIKLWLLGLSLFGLIIADGCALSTGQSRVGGVLEKWQTENKTFKIRVTTYEEKEANLNGALYQFESAVSGSNEWREIVIFRDDDRPKIPVDQVRFLNDHVGYLFMGWIYAVTTDGGSNWTIWNARNDLPNWQCCNYALIDNVQLTAEGAGTMTLNPIPGRQGEVSQLHTRDYGQHWSAE